MDFSSAVMSEGRRRRQGGFALVGGLLSAVIVSLLLVVAMNGSDGGYYYQGLSESNEISLLSTARLRNGESGSESQKEPSSTTVKRVWTQDEIIKTFPSIQEYLVKVNATSETLDDYVPKEFVFEYDLALVEKDIGPDASTGFIAMGLFRYHNVALRLNGWSSHSSVINYILLVSIRGDILDMVPMDLKNGHVNFLAVKPYSADTFTLTSSENQSMSGPVYNYNWQKKELSTVSNNNIFDGHDLQWSYNADGSIYTPNTYGFAKVFPDTDVITGEYVLSSTDEDLNHVQLIDEDRTAIVSDRSSSMIYAYDTVTKTNLWTCGLMGTIPMYDLDGSLLSDNDSLFLGQHNAEYFGLNEYYIFDNNYDINSVSQDQGRSRLVIVDINYPHNATLLWEYDLPGFTSVYGENDRLPSSNMLSVWWPSTLNKVSGAYDAHAFEITRDTKEIAWKFKIKGHGCDFEITNACNRSTSDGWKMYSAERFYTEPLVYNLDCQSNTLKFSTQNTFKYNNPYPGKALWVAHDGTILADTDFSWFAFWRETKITLKSSAVPASYDSSTLTVTNKVGQSKTVTLDCPATA